MVSMADATMGQVSDDLLRMREPATQANMHAGQAVSLLG